MNIRYKYIKVLNKVLKILEACDTILSGGKIQILPQTLNYTHQKYKVR